MLVVPSYTFAIGASNGYIPHADRKITADERKSIMQVLEAQNTQCIYGNLGDQFFNREWEPEIFDVQNSCGDKEDKSHRPLCVGTVICRTPLMNFTVEKATCWAPTQTLARTQQMCGGFVFNISREGKGNIRGAHLPDDPAREGHEVKFYFFFAILFWSVIVLAADQAVRVRTYRFANQNLEEQSKIDSQAQAALRSMLTDPKTKCKYLSPDGTGEWAAFGKAKARPAAPEYFQVRGNCENSEPRITAVCGAEIQCETDLLKMVFQNAFCLAVGDKKCPSATECALANSPARSIKGIDPKTQKQRVGLLQAWRGWSEGNTNRYPWVQANQQDFERWKREREQRGERDENEGQ